MPPYLQFDAVTKTYVGVTALQEVTFGVSEGTVHALMGENGAGKSTLIKTLSGIYPHGTYGGDILIDGGNSNFHDTIRRGAALHEPQHRLPPGLAARVGQLDHHQGRTDRDLVPLLALGPQRLAEASLVVGDEAGRGTQDMAGRTVIFGFGRVGRMVADMIRWVATRAT